MKKLLIPFLLFGVLSISCSKDDISEEEKTNLVSETTKNLEVESFIFNAMDEVYLYEAEVPEFKYGYFKTSTDKNKFLASFDSPEELYEGIQPSHDEFSFMTDDYVALENMFKGVSLSNGMDYGLGYLGSNGDLFGYVRYVVTGSSAEEQGVKRGDIFTKINGTQLHVDNYRNLLQGASYTINLGRIENQSIVLSNKTVQLTGQEISENPVHLSKVLEVEGKKIGYLVYNGFTATDAFDSGLNAVFAEFKNQVVDELILDLRYNGGGNVETAIDLASMITGQFNGEIIIKEQWNEKYQKAWEPESYIRRFNNTIRTGEAINSLNLTRLYVLTTGSSASASELVINGLEPYINVVQIGENTRGKFQASTTLYDGEGYARSKANPNHKYAIQPLIFKSANAEGKTDFKDGLIPDVAVEESVGDMGTLGDPSETLLKAAINDILGQPQEAVSVEKSKIQEKFKDFGEKGMLNPTYQRMYVDQLPEEFLGTQE